MSADITIDFDDLELGISFKTEIACWVRCKAEWTPRDGFDLELARVFVKDKQGYWQRIDDDSDFNCITAAVKRELMSGKYDPDISEYRSGQRDSWAEDREAFRRAG